MSTQRTHDALDMAIWMAVAGIVFPFLLIALGMPFIHLPPASSRLSAALGLVGEQLPTMLYELPPALCGITAATLAMHAHDIMTRRQLVQRVLLFVACNYALFVLINTGIWWHVSRPGFDPSGTPYGTLYLAYVDIYRFNYIQPLLAVCLSAWIGYRLKASRKASVPSSLGISVLVLVFGCFAFALLAQELMGPGNAVWEGTSSVFTFRPYDILIRDPFHAKDALVIPVLLGALAGAFLHKRREGTVAHPPRTLLVGFAAGYAWLWAAPVAVNRIEAWVTTWSATGRWALFTGAFSALAAVFAWIGCGLAIWLGTRVPAHTLRDAWKRLSSRLTWWLDDSAR